MGESHASLEFVFRIVDEKTLTFGQRTHVHGSELKGGFAIQAKKEVHVLRFQDQGAGGFAGAPLKAEPFNAFVQALVSDWAIWTHNFMMLKYD